jgi:hypothetical protein
MLSLLIAAAAVTAAPPPESNVLVPSPVLRAGLANICQNDKPDDVIVCGKPGQPYRIDSSVLAASRAANARPPKPPVTADTLPSNNCVGPDSCSGGVIPLVGMALVAAEAASLAAHGDDWRDAIRTQPDEYRLYEQAEARRESERKVRIGITAASK